MGIRSFLAEFADLVHVVAALIAVTKLLDRRWWVLQMTTFRRWWKRRNRRNRK